MSKQGGSGKRSGEGDLRFEAFSFGAIPINGTTYEYDVLIDRGHVSKRNKKIGHTADGRSDQDAPGESC